MSETKNDTEARAELEILDQLKNCSNRELFDALVTERAKNLEMRERHETIRLTLEDLCEAIATNNNQLGLDSISKISKLAIETRKP